MLSLTLTQPWASLMVSIAMNELLVRNGELTDALKPLETRSWRIADNRLPLRVAIHAGKGIDPMLRANIVGADHRFKAPFRDALHACGYSTLSPWMKGYADRFGNPEGGIVHELDGLNTCWRPLPLSAVVGSVTIVKMFPSDMITKAWQACKISDVVYNLGNFAPGRWAWQAKQPMQTKWPTHCVGALGLWTLPDAIATSLESEERLLGVKR